MADLTHARLTHLISYDPTTGVMVWKNPTSRRVTEGGNAGVVASNGRRYVAIDNTRYLAHRLAWFWVYQRWPAEGLSAKNGDYDDLRIENYVEVTNQEIARNRYPRELGSSGARGVSWDKSKGKWVAYISADYKSHYVGRFNTKEEAIAAREAAIKEKGIAPVTAVDNTRAIHASRQAKLRVVWRKTLRQTYEVVGWNSFEEFAEDVKSAPAGGRQILVPVDPEKILGPGNFQWVSASQWDFGSPEGRQAYMRFHRDANRNSYRHKELKRNFGIGLQEYHAMFEAQNGVCASCGEPEHEKRDGKLRMLAVDHCHTTGAIRGLLCGSCNRGIGKFGDDPVKLEKAAAYLRRHAAKSGSVITINHRASGS